MKQTNNAIKFLMAQYRAIFKNANIAMVAAIAAAALASGQAQAAATESFNNTILANPDTATKVDVTGAQDGDGEYKKIELTGGAADGGKEFNITLSASSGDSSFKGTKDNALIDLSNSTLKIAGADKTSAKLTIGDSTETTRVSLKNLDVSKSGTLALTAKADAQSGEGTFVNVETIVLGGGETPASGDIAVTLDKNTSLTGTESLTIKTGAAVTVSGGATLGGGTIAVEDGSITLGTASTTDTVGVLSATDKLDIQGGTLEVANAGAATITASSIDFAGELTNSGTLTVKGDVVAKDGSTVTNKLNLTLENGFTAKSGSTVTSDVEAGSVTLAGTSNFESGSTLNNSGNMIVTGSTTIETEAAKVEAGANSKLTVSGGKVNMSSAVLKKFLTGTVQSVKGSSGVINLTDSGEAIALGDGGAGIFAASTGNMSNKLGVASQGELKITAEKAKFEGADAVSGADVNAGVTLAFNELTLGNTAAEFTVKGVNLEIAKNIKIKENKGLKLQDGAKLTLNGAGTSLDLEAITLANAGAGGTLNVNSGDWGVKTLTVTKGQAKVEKGAKLTLTKGLTTTDASGKLVINGGVVDAKAVETLKLNANGASITNAGKLILSADKVVKAADSSLIDTVYAKNAVQGTTDAQISLLDNSGNDECQYKSRYKSSVCLTKNNEF